MQLREMDILIHRNGQQYGPYSQQDILKYLNDGSLTQNDLAWYEGAPQWVPLRNIPTLNLVNGAHSIPPPPQSVISPFYSTLLSKPFDVNGYVMLAIPTVAAFFIWQADSLGVSAFVFQVLATVSTAILAVMEAKRLGMGSNTDRTPKGKNAPDQVPGPELSCFYGLLDFQPIFLHAAGMGPETYSCLQSL